MKMKKILPLAMLVSTACGDTNNSYYTNGETDNNKSGSSYTVEDACESFAECEIDPHHYRTPMEKCVSQLQSFATIPEVDGACLYDCFVTTCKMNTEDYCFSQCM